MARDNAIQMLEQARKFASLNNFDNIDFVLGDTGSEQLVGLQVDCAVINMVLHHTPDPGQILKDVASALAPEGVVLVTDLCHHDQVWARENCGDLWLGFNPAN